MGGGNWGSMEGPGGKASLHDGDHSCSGCDDSPPEGLPKRGRPAESFKEKDRLEGDNKEAATKDDESDEKEKITSE